MKTFDGSKYCPTPRAPDWWESARFQAVFVARSWFRQNGVVSSHLPAGNASRWAAEIGYNHSFEVYLLSKR